MKNTHWIIGLALWGALGWGLDVYHVRELAQTQQNEAQANGLESQCKATLAKINEDAANDPNNPDNEQEEIVAPKVKLHEDYVRPQ